MQWWRDVDWNIVGPFILIFAVLPIAMLWGTAVCLRRYVRTKKRRSLLTAALLLSGPVVIWAGLAYIIWALLQFGAHSSH